MIFIFDVPGYSWRRWPDFWGQYIFQQNSLLPAYWTTSREIYFFFNDKRTSSLPRTFPSYDYTKILWKPISFLSLPLEKCSFFQRSKLRFRVSLSFWFTPPFACSSPLTTISLSSVLFFEYQMLLAETQVMTLFWGFLTCAFYPSHQWLSRWAAKLWGQWELFQGSVFTFHVYNMTVLVLIHLG